MKNHVFFKHINRLFGGMRAQGSAELYRPDTWVCVLAVVPTHPSLLIMYLAPRGPEFAIPGQDTASLVNQSQGRFAFFATTFHLCTPAVVDPALFLCVSFCFVMVPRLLVSLNSFETLRLLPTLGVP